jgi:hypothetical protein
MLIDNKFFYIPLPRCASTSFFATCVKENIKIETVRDWLSVDTQIKKFNIDINNLNYDTFPQQFRHAHEPLNLMIEKFGNHETISVKRNKYDRFISTWNHILHEMHLHEHPYIFRKCLSLKLDDILFYKSENIVDSSSTQNTINEFISRNSLEKIGEYGINMIMILLKPASDYHHHNKDIIWFDFEKLWELENWVSNKLNRNFKLLKINSSSHYSGCLKLDANFMNKYDSIYEVYDVPKTQKSLI